MLHGITGTPGASKTAFVVSKLDEIERKNKVHLKKNKVIFAHNMPLFEIYRSDFSYVEVESGSANELKRTLVVLPDDYFDFLTQDFDDLRPDFYFQRSVQYNEIIDRINEREGHQKFEYLQPVRTIYSNINALKIDYTRALIADWREAPDGSIFVIDEVQNVAPYSETKVKDPIVQDLTIHRHRGFDFYFITQSPSFLHPTVKELIGVHYHITRPYGRTPKVYQFGSIRQYPNTLINKLNCESKFSFKPQDRIFKLYKSTTINTHQKRMPAGLIPLVIFVGLASLMFFWGMHDRSKLNHKPAVDSASVQQKNKSASTTATPSTATAATSQTDLDTSCRKAENIDKPDCQKWLDNLTKNHGSLGSQDAQAQAVSYHPDQPFSDSSIKQSIQYTVVNKPVFAGCVRYNGRYYGYTEQGTKLNISQADCKRVMNGDRPYDYFRQQNQQQLQVQQTSDSKSISKDDSKQLDSNVHLIENNPTFPEKDITKPTI